VAEDLREQVARRLEQVIAPWGDRILDEGGWLEAQADEVIRCMEWAWELGRQNGRHEENSTYEPDSEVLTLPPEDWHP